MGLNPFASAFVPGRQSVKEAAVPAAALPFIKLADSQPAAPSSGAEPARIPQAAAALGAITTPFAAHEAATQAASTNSSGDEALQLEFEDLFHRSAHVRLSLYCHTEGYIQQSRSRLHLVKALSILACKSQISSLTVVRSLLIADLLLI